MKLKLVIALILTMIAVSGCSAYAQSAYRDLRSDNVDFGISSDMLPGQEVSSMTVKNAGEDRNQKLYSVVGKSQILRFDQSIKRVSITNYEIADVVVLSPKQLLVNGKKPGSTSLIFWGTSNIPIFYNLVVQQDADSFIQAVSYIAPHEDVSILFNDTGAVLSGQVSSTAVKEKIKDLAKAYSINLVDLSESPTKQVLLEVKVVEASKNFSRNLSSSFGVGDNARAISGDILSNSFGQLISNSGLKYLFAGDGGELTWQLTAAEKKGEAKVLAEPKLLAVDGKEASFNVGNEVPVPSSIGQYGQVSYDFKKTGVLLNFTPTIMEKSDRIRLQLSPEVSEIDRSVGAVTTNDQIAVYGFKTRKVDTTVELQSGETLVIAGLLNTNSSRNKNQVPILGDIPILGFLFRSTEDTKNDGELMIFITPHIVDNKSAPQNL